jgi:hypothetical protein
MIEGNIISHFVVVLDGWRILQFREEVGKAEECIEINDFLLGKQRLLLLFTGKDG